MLVTFAGRMLVLSSLFVILASGAAQADPRDRFAQETGLGIDLIGVVQAEVDGVELTLTFVFLNERTFDSRISPALRAALEPYTGQNALYVNPSVEHVVPSFPFSPSEISVRQDGGAVDVAAGMWVEITPGFAAGRFEVNPSGPERGSGSEGILVLGDAIDATRPFELLFRGQEVRFHIAASPPPRETAGASHEPVDVSLLGETSTLQAVLMREEFASESMAALLELDPALVRVLVLPAGGEELRLFFVRLEASVRDSALGTELVSAVDPLIGTGAVMVWAFSAGGAAFSPWTFYVKQAGTNYLFFSPASFVGLTEGFLRVERVKPGDVAAGVIRLPKSVDSAKPFSLYYATTGVDFP